MANSKMDNIILKLQNNIQQKKKSLEKIKRPEWKTNCSFVFNNGDRFNLHTVDKEILIRIASEVVTINSSTEQALQMLGIDDNVKIGMNMGTYNDWMHDLKLRLEIINKKKLEEELKIMEADLESVLSEEKKAELKVKAIEEKLKNI